MEPIVPAVLFTTGLGWVSVFGSAPSVLALMTTRLGRSVDVAKAGRP